jgi:hypothetical protein
MRRDDDSNGLFLLSVGAVAGLFAGVAVAQRYGGFAGFAQVMRERLGVVAREIFDERDDDEFESEESEDLDEIELADEDAFTLHDAVRLERRVLRAFRRDAVLRRRALEIEAQEMGVIGLFGAVHSDEELERAVRVAARVEGVVRVIERVEVVPAAALPDGDVAETSETASVRQTASTEPPTGGGEASERVD